MQLFTDKAIVNRDELASVTLAYTLPFHFYSVAGVLLMGESSHLYFFWNPKIIPFYVKVRWHMVE